MIESHPAADLSWLQIKNTIRMKPAGHGAHRAASILAVLFTCFAACNDPQDPDDPGDPPVTDIGADIVSDHFTFFTATKQQGNSPAGGSTRSLQISIRDTLHLAGSLPRSVRILHRDTTQNVSGVWIQVRTSASTGGLASYHYDVSELEDLEKNDTLSAIMIGMDPQGLELPLTFDVKITPYDKHNVPLGEKIVPVRLDKPKKDLQGCGPGLPAGEHWQWFASYVQGDTQFDFENYPGKAFSSGGADIEGSCCNGNTRWPDFCIGEYQHNRTLHFSTYYTIKFEVFSLLSNGSFMRSTLEDSPVPWPAGSDFCAGGEGMTQESLKLTDYDGTWEVLPVNIPANAHASLKDDTHELRLITTGSSGTGYGNPGGVIHQLDCDKGYLTLAQVNAGGSFANPIWKFYLRHRNGEPTWYQF